MIQAPHLHPHARRKEGSPRRPSPRGIVGRLLSVISAASLALVALVVMPMAAQAAPNPAIVVADVTIESSDGAEATVGDILTLSGNWDASAANPQPGDTFTIGLPSVLGFPQAVPFTLDGPDQNGDVVTWATCLTDPASGVATCTLTDEVVANPELVRGTFAVDIEATGATTDDEVLVDLNGVPMPIDLPGEGGIDDGVVLPDTWDKSGELNADKWSMTWTIDLPGSRLAGEDVVNILEQLSDNHELCAPPALRVETVRGSTLVDVSAIGSTSTDVPSPYGYSIVLTAPDGGFDPNVTYRISYDTCTPDGQIDPQGTVYENEATVDVWGESSGVIGVTQDWAFTGQVSKQGSVLGGGDRNGAIRWTVTVAGDHLDGKDGFTLSESLTGEHEMCAATIDGIRVFERYGPSTTQQREITGDLDATTVSSSASGFEVEFAIADGSDFEFLPSDFLYVIQYETCATTDGLPEGGTAFGNTASVDGAEDGSQATVPGRTDQKRGVINASAVTIDGVEYLPQTTLAWTITVPGENIADVAGDLIVTDVLSGAHQVCVGQGGDVASRLGLSVEARDQIQNGGLATVDLSDDATADLVGDAITITIPEPTLAQPGGGEAAGFSREYQYVIRYTTCTTSGGMDAPGTTYGNDAEVAGNSYSQTVTQNNRGSGTGQGVTRGSIGIVKDLADTPGAAFVPDDAVFTVRVREIDPTGTVQVEYDLEVPLDGAPVSGPNSRGLGWTAELSEPTFPSIPGVTFGAPVFAPGDGLTVGPDGTTVIAELDPGSNIAVSLTNTAELGSLAVTKVLDGPAADLVDPDREYSVTAEIDTSALGAGFPAQPDRTFTLEAGETVVLEELPIGATVSFSEAVPADDDILTWSPAVITPASLEVLPEHAAQPTTVTVTNHVARTVGTFSIVKIVTGDQAGNPAVPDEVTVTATWEVDGIPAEKTLTVPTDGTPVPLGESLLIGTEVTLTETPLADGSSIAWGAPVWSGTGVTVDGDEALVTIGRDTAATVTLENHAATSTAGISLLKGLAGDAAGEVDPATEFSVTATWTDAAGVEHTRELTINAVDPTPLGVQLPAGTVVTITEGTRPAFDTVVWGSVTISGADVTDAGDGSATITVSPQQSDVTLVTVVNEANWAPGSFALSKDVVGVLLDDPDVPDDVTVTASWVDEAGAPQSRDLTLPTDGTAVPLGIDLPHGTEVLLTELAPQDSERFTWNAPAWAGTGVVDRSDGTALLTISAATAPEVTLTNEVTAALGSLELTKTLTGDGASSLPQDIAFPVTLTWTDLLGEPQQVDAEVRVGTPTIVNGVPFGTEVRIVEHDARLPHGVRWAGADWSSADADVDITTGADGAGAVVVVSGAAGEQAALTITNDIRSVPDLALTGSGGVLAAAVAALGLLLAGIGVLTVWRRRSA